jgi:hypothetical protein
MTRSAESATVVDVEAKLGELRERLDVVRMKFYSATNAAHLAGVVVTGEDSFAP